LESPQLAYNRLQIELLRGEKGKSTASDNFPDPISLEHVEQAGMISLFPFFLERSKMKWP